MATNFSLLPPLPPLRDFIHMYRSRAKKVLSQNYLMDMNLTRKVCMLVLNLERNKTNSSKQHKIG
ncbi:hypothetical protein ANCCAN_26782 [Ancylostoma caninum]|uniref:Uncharacterized protein n=1 Tax=Ancylostoma caninum TaxID=29170 RepID=A0A368F5R3_ANCCA|nr:hypothetical protein ANCCAN_26782 [Ancylostoma caninum]